jgi:hypothetical protein
MTREPNWESGLHPDAVLDRGNCRALRTGTALTLEVIGHTDGRQRRRQFMTPSCKQRGSCFGRPTKHYDAQMRGRRYRRTPPAPLSPFLLYRAAGAPRRKSQSGQPSVGRPRCLSVRGQRVGRFHRESRGCMVAGDQICARASIGRDRLKNGSCRRVMLPHSLRYSTTPCMLWRLVNGSHSRLGTHGSRTT